jgi:hypothetical protein
MSADKIDTSGRRSHQEIEEEMKQLISSYRPDQHLVEDDETRCEGDVPPLPQRAEADPLVTGTTEFCGRMQLHIDTIARQMDNRAYILEKKAEELRNRASKLKHYGTTLTGDMRQFSELLREYRDDVQSLSLIEVRDDQPKEDGER